MDAGDRIARGMSKSIAFLDRNPTTAEFIFKGKYVTEVLFSHFAYSHDSRDPITAHGVEEEHQL